MMEVEYVRTDIDDLFTCNIAPDPKCASVEVQEIMLLRVVSNVFLFRCGLVERNYACFVTTYDARSNVLF